MGDIGPSFDAMKVLILKKVGAQAYKVELAPKTKYHPIFHVSLLKPYHRDEVDPSRNIFH